MQLDMFGATDKSAIQDSAPPVLTASGAWVPPEAVALNAALTSGSLVDAIAILNQLKGQTLARVLLASGFSVSSGNRAAVIKVVQSDLVAATRLRLTGHQLFAYRAQERAQTGLAERPAQAADTSQAQALPIRDVRIGDLVRKDGHNYTVTGAIEGGVSADGEFEKLGSGVESHTTILLKGDEVIIAKIAYEEWAKSPINVLAPPEGDRRVTLELLNRMKSGMRVIDGKGQEYEAFSTRFAYLEVFPVGENGKAQVFAGNSVFFHLDPQTAGAYPTRRHDPLYLQNPLQLENVGNLADNPLNNAHTIDSTQQGNANGRVDQPRNLRARTGVEDRDNGLDISGGSEPLATGLAGPGDGSSESRDLRDLPGTTSGSREGRAGRRDEPSAPGTPRDPENVRSAGSATSDRQIAPTHQNPSAFAGAENGELDEVFDIVQQPDGQFRLESDDSILAGNGDGSPRRFATVELASTFAQANGYALAQPQSQTIAANLSASNTASYGAQLGMFDAELKTEYDAVAERDELREQARRDRLMRVREKLESDTSAWDQSPFAPRILSMLDSLRQAGSEADDMRHIILAGITVDAKTDRLTEDSIAFRETVARRELARISSNGVRPVANWEQVTPATLAEQETDIGKLPLEIVQAASDKLNTLGEKLASLGFASQYEVDPRAPTDAREIADHMRAAVNSMLMLAPIRERIAKGHKNAKQAKLDRMEDFASVAIGVNTREYPGVNTVSQGNAVAQTEKTSLPNAVGEAMQKDMQAQQARFRKAQTAAKQEGSTLSQRLGLQAKVAIEETALRSMRLSVFDAEDAAIAALAAADVARFQEHGILFPNAQLSIAATIQTAVKQVNEQAFSTRHLTDVQANAKLTPAELEDKIAQFEAMRDEAVKTLQTRGLSVGQRRYLTENVASHQAIIDDAQTALDLRRHIANQPGAEQNTATQTQDPGQREAFEHEGVKIYPVDTKAGPRWAVQTQANRTSGKVLGDTLHIRVGDAKQEAFRQNARSVAQARDAAELQAEKDTKLSNQSKLNKEMGGFLEQANYSPMLTARSRLALDKPVRYEGKEMPSYAFVQALLAKGLVPTTAEVDRNQPMSRMAFFRATNEQQRAHEERIRNGGKKTVHHIGGFEVGSFEYAYASYLQSRAAVVAKQDAPELALDAATERYQWKRNAEGGQSFGNQQTIHPMTQRVFDQFVAPLLRAELKTFDAYRSQFPDVTHVNVILNAKGEVQLGTPSLGTLAELRPSPNALEKGWAIQVASFSEETALTQGNAADSDAFASLNSAPPREVTVVPDNVNLPPTDEFSVTDDDRIGMGTVSEKFADNMRAIRLLRTLASERRNAVGEERNTLARYVGWGGLKGVFDSQHKKWGRQHAALRELLTDAEWNAASRSQLDAFYTKPIVVNAMYAAVQQLGFQHGRTLDPGVGVGNFFGLMPSSMRERSTLHGVELDVLTSQIVSALYPRAAIAKATGFENYKMPGGYFDMVIGNPPFGSHRVADEKGSVYSGWSIHNYFFAKSIELLRPGGIMPMVVTHNFLDKLDPHVRRWIARRAELVSGVRLPDTAFKDNANTEVVTDILLFRRLDDANVLGKQDSPDWLETTDVVIDNPETGESQTVTINNYFVKNPGNVLGTNAATGSMYRGNEYSVVANGDLEMQLAQWVQHLPRGLYKALERPAQELELAAVAVPDSVKEGSFFVQGDDVWQRLTDLDGQQRAAKWTTPNQRAGERMRGMIDLRERLREQMRMERTLDVDNNSQIEDGRRGLNQAYDAFQRKFGFINDPVNRRLFLDDTECALIEALEFDYEKSVSTAKALEHGIEETPSKARKADIFTRRVLFPPGEERVVESAKDALLHSLNYTGGIDLAFMQRAYPKDEAAIITELAGLVYEDPVQGYVTADAYLSGDVKTKLREVTQAAERDSSLLRNVEALKAVIPRDKLPSEIHASIGASWIPVKVFSDFAKEIAGGDASFTYVPSTAQWLEQNPGGMDRTKSSSEFGTEKMSAFSILTHLMNSRAPEVKKKVLVDDVERYVTDEPQTELVRQKANKIRAHWDSWLWSDGDRADQLATIYNDRFNRTVERRYDGSHMTFPGISRDIELLGHQKNGAWRGLQSRRMLLDQVVSAGKTFEMVALAMEMRRLGISRKPLFAVPNHLTLQWRSEFYRLYPGANVLAATPKDFEKEHRERFFSKVVTGNWDAVIIGHSSLKKIPVPIEAETKIIREQFDDISKAIEDLKRDRGDRNVVRDMEKIKITLELKLDRLVKKAGSKDKVVDFSDLGVDALFIDEHHEFKNLFFSTQMNRVAGLGNPAGSGKAFDLFVKFRWLEETFGTGAPLITATGTPISNSLAEMFTMQRYMQYGQLKDLDLHVFDAWAKQYGDVQNVYEVAPSGTGYRLSQRFAHFKNLGSLMGQYRSFADVLTLDDLKAQEAARGKTFPVPKVLGDRPTNIVAQRSELQERFFGIPEIVRDEAGHMVFEIDVAYPTLIEPTEEGKFVIRQDLHDADGKPVTRHMPRCFDTVEEAQEALVIGAMTPRMRVDPKSIVGQFENLRELTRSTKGKINALSLTSLANKAGLDYRLIDPHAPDFPGSKINEAVRRIVDIGRQWEADKGTQLIFCDLSVPLSAKSRMASKEKRVYVRDDSGFIVHKRGTLHCLKDYEGLPYYLVPVRNGKEKTFSIYDPVSGALMKEGCDSKQDAHAFVTGFVGQEGGQERWLDEREKCPSMGVDEIEEYKNEHTLDADGDAADLEISLQDIEGATGVSGFSVYDDMKAKLIAAGVPATQIEFIHDHDTPQAKQDLFRRINAGEVRYTFGSTPKMGAGTNVQELVVAEHHIDAPWRPSDLEQREGRVIRRGNKLYERDPEGFRVFIGRYATAQTYDTRRWQILQHKASGLEQLRNYAGANEIEDVAGEAANSADMKAAASGNPLILRETQLSNEVKTLRLLERAHRDGEFSGRRRLEWCQFYINKEGPRDIANWQSMQATRDQATVLARYQGKNLEDKEQLMKFVDDVAAKTSRFTGSFALTYRGLIFTLARKSVLQDDKTLIMPDGTIAMMESFSRVGVVTRMENWVNGIDGKISAVQAWIANAEKDTVELKSRLGSPFPQADALKTAVAEHGKVQRALVKSNALSAIKPGDAQEFEAAVLTQKQRLVDYGFVDALTAFEAHDAELNSLTSQQTGPAVEQPLLSLSNCAHPQDQHFFYVDGALGMQSNGSFTREQSHWMTFTRNEASAMLAKDIKPYGATRKGTFVGTENGTTLKPKAIETVEASTSGMEMCIKVATDSALLSKADASAVNVDHLKTRMVERLTVDVPATWIVMNAPRPLLGTRTMEGDFVTGCFYAVIDPCDPMAENFVSENEKLDARLLAEISRETQMEVALLDNEHRNQYMQREPEERYKLLAPTLNKLRDLPYGELRALICQAKGVVQEGVYSGPVLDVTDGVVTQKINRSGGTVCHDVSRLSLPASVGASVEIHYQQGVGRVSSSTQKATDLGR